MLREGWNSESNRRRLDMILVVQPCWLHCGLTQSFKAFCWSKAEWHRHVWLALHPAVHTSSHSYGRIIKGCTWHHVIIKGVLCWILLVFFVFCWRNQKHQSDYFELCLNIVFFLSWLHLGLHELDAINDQEVKDFRSKMFRLSEEKMQRVQMMTCTEWLQACFSPQLETSAFTTITDGLNDRLAELKVIIHFDQSQVRVYCLMPHYWECQRCM